MDHDSGAPDDAPTRATSLPLLPIPIIVIALVLAIVFAVGADWNANDTLSSAEGLPDLQQDLAAHEWLLDRTDSSLPTESVKPVTLVFGEERVSGMGPCNSYRGRLDVDDDDGTVEISDIAQTNVACDDTTMRAEREYFTRLEQIRDVDLSGGHDRNRLVLTNDDGARLAYDALDVEDLVVGSWHVVSVARGDAIQSVVAGSDPVLRFEADGDLGLDSGCNRVRGTYELDGDRLLVGGLAQTFKKCTEPAGVMDQEAALVRALDTGARVAVTAGRLTILDGEGRTLLVAVDQDADR